MEAKFEEIEADLMVVYLKGRIDLETIEPFVGCLDHLKPYKVIFDMRELSFVGSNGITTFIDSMKSLAASSREGIKFCQVSSEFSRIFAASLAPVIEMHENLQTAKLAFKRPLEASFQKSTGFQNSCNYSSFGNGFVELPGPGSIENLDSTSKTPSSPDEGEGLCGVMAKPD